LAGGSSSAICTMRSPCSQNCSMSGSSYDSDVSTYHILWSDVVLVESSALGYELESVDEKPRAARPKSEAKSARAAKAEAKAERGAAKKSAAKKTTRKAEAKSAKPKAKTAKKSTAKKSAGKKKGK